MSQYPIIAGAEEWSHDGEGERGQLAVVVSHGFTGNPVSTRWLGEELGRRGYSVDVIRLPGHGTHHKDMGATRYEDWRGRLNAAIDTQLGRGRKVAVAGLSMGGTLALDVAWERGRSLVGVIPINASVLDRPGLLAKLAPALAHVMPYVPASVAGLAENDAAREGVDEKAYAVVPNHCGVSLLSQLPRLRRQLPQVDIPVLVAYSPQDHSVGPENSKAALRLLKHAEELVLPRSYHLATMDLDRDLLADRIEAFLERARGAQA